MISSYHLLQIADAEGIIVEYLNLPNDFLGLYLLEPTLNQPHIGLDISLLTNERLNKCVLAHELGHFFRSASASVTAASTTAMYYVCRSERLANDWAVDKLVPAVPFLKLVKKQFSFEEVVDYFNVVPEFIMHRARRIYRNGLNIPELRHYLRNERFRIPS